MQLFPLKSQRFEAGSDLHQYLLEALSTADQQLKSGDILVIASKVVAYSQGLLREVKNKEDLKKLIHQEADRVVDEGLMVLTMKNHVLIPNAGIDQSNTPENQAILWPEKPFGVARELHEQLKEEFKLDKLGVIISDSHCQPLRLGTTGLAMGWAGFEGVRDERGKNDLFGRPMHYTRLAVADNLASAATLLMGETDASLPFVLVREAPVDFTDKVFTEEDYFISPEECLYAPFFKNISNR